ncbi:EcsC family protein [Cognatiyoonia sp. IB215446]|uniref:EcsC family protein n=1 Tax=Cognatiyoonia sp. IB215446 TaxID=3097355 RepID=UPI002A16E2CD|nr:EcsC family protein [Cognatiyoonia sp. IB215446]MDX8347304.1 EcsC family protein [Cognatiyoonia sp. IB215446]
MSDADLTLKEVNPANPPQPLTDDARAEITEIAQRQKRANGVLMSAINFVGGQVEDSLKLLPKSTRAQVDALARKALRQSFDVAHASRQGAGSNIGSDRLHKLVGTVSGAVGGLGGLPTALAELPVTTTVIFRAVHHVATEYGEDPDAPETRMECLAVFGAGGPGSADDGVDTALIGARLSITGAAVNGLIGRVAPRFAAVLSQKLASQAVPVLGAAAGAGTNYAFIDYYVAMAHVHFGLRRLARIYGEEAVLDEFHRVLAAAKVPVQT